MLQEILRIIEKFSFLPGPKAQLPDNIKEAFDLLDQISDTLISDYTELKQILCDKDSEYEQLEQAVQKGEGDIRVHIRLQQQMKLYSDSIQNRLDDKEKLSEEITVQNDKILNDKEQHNLKLIQKVKQLQDEVQKLTSLNKKQDDDHDGTSNNNLTRHNINRAQEFISSIKEEQKKFNIDDYGAKVYTVLNLRANIKCTTLPTTKMKTSRDNVKFPIESERNRSEKETRIGCLMTYIKDLSRSSRQLGYTNGKNISMRNIRDLRVSQHLHNQNNSQESQGNNSKNYSQHNSNGVIKIYNNIKIVPRKESAPRSNSTQFQLSSYLNSKR